MLFPGLILFFLFLLLSAFFSSSETAFIAANPYKLDYLEKKGIKKAKLVRKMIKRMDNLLEPRKCSRHNFVGLGQKGTGIEKAADRTEKDKEPEEKNNKQDKASD